MIQWRRDELRTLALWHLNLAYHLGDGFEVLLTATETTCPGHTLHDPEALDVARDMLLTAWQLEGPLAGKWRLRIRRGGDLLERPERGK